MNLQVIKMAQRKEGMQCNDCSYKFESVNDENLKCPKCDSKSIKGIRQGLKFRVI